MDDLSVVYCKFLSENGEILDQLTRNLIALGRNPEDKQILASISSTIRTIKGTCDFFSFDKLGHVTLAGQNLLTLLSDGTIPHDQAQISALLALIDAVRDLLAHIAATGSQNDVDYADLIATLTRLQCPAPDSASR